jgi:1D-myo-inositol 3-kinase
VESLPAPDIVVVGHSTLDVFDAGNRPGGPGPYVSLVAARLGLRTALLTAAGPEIDLAMLLPGVKVAVVDRSTTMMRHSYEHGARVQHALVRAGPIGSEDVPAEWRTTKLLLLAPILGEVNPSVVSAFPDALIGADPQGWLRRVQADGRVAEGNLEGVDVGALAGRVSVVSLSEEDLAGTGLPDDWLEAFPVIILTRAHRGLRLRCQGRWWQMRAFPAREVDPTGAGDSLSAAFLIRYAETADAGEAARFAAATSSFVVEGAGFEGVPLRKDVERRMAENPGIRLRPDS